LSYHAVYLHYCKWSKDGSLEKVWHYSIKTIAAKLNLSELNLDGSHTIAKKGGQSVLCDTPLRLEIVRLLAEASHFPRALGTTQPVRFFELNGYLALLGKLAAIASVPGYCR
jgi:hypothetical protein